MPQLETPSLEQSINAERGLQSRWYAVYTKSRHEKLVQEQFQRRGIESFLPLRRIERRWSDRRKMVEDPLFKGYLFVKIALVSRWDVLGTTGVVRLVGRSSGEPAEVSERDIATIRRLVESEIQADPFPYLKEGQRVYIRSGPLKGIEGFIVHKDKRCRLVISLDLAMQSVSVQVDEACIEPL